MENLQQAVIDLQNAIKALRIANQCAERAINRVKPNGKPKLTIVKKE